MEKYNSKKQDKKDFRNELHVEGINSRGYGLINKMVMLDRKLPLESKGIYAYFCSYAGSGDQAFPSVKKIYSDLCISKDRYYKYFEFLKVYGYITVKERKNEKGEFDSNLYTLVQNPAIQNDERVKQLHSKKKTKSNLIEVKGKKINGIKKPYPDFEDMEKKPFPQNPDTENPDTENPDTENQDSNIINLSKNINLFKINNLSKNISQSVYKKENLQQINEITKKLKTQIGYDSLIELSHHEPNINEELVNDVLALLLDMYFSKHTCVNKELKPQEIIRSVISKLDHWAIIDLIGKIQKIENVTNIRAYLNTMIYNQALEFNAKVQNDTNNLFLNND
jgi:hypothetical protein